MYKCIYVYLYVYDVYVYDVYVHVVPPISKTCNTSSTPEWLPSSLWSSKIWRFPYLEVPQKWLVYRENPTKIETPISRLGWLLSTKLSMLSSTSWRFSKCSRLVFIPMTMKNPSGTLRRTPRAPSPEPFRSSRCIPRKLSSAKETAGHAGIGFGWAPKINDVCGLIARWATHNRVHLENTCKCASLPCKGKRHWIMTSTTHWSGPTKSIKQAGSSCYVQYQRVHWVLRHFNTDI